MNSITSEDEAENVNAFQRRESIKHPVSGRNIWIRKYLNIARSVPKQGGNQTSWEEYSNRKIFEYHTRSVPKRGGNQTSWEEYSNRKIFKYPNIRHTLFQIRKAILGKVNVNVNANAFQRREVSKNPCEEYLCNEWQSCKEASKKIIFYDLNKVLTFLIKVIFRCLYVIFYHCKNIFLQQL